MKIKINEIKISKNRYVKLNEDHVSELAKSIDEIGLLQPITLCADNTLIAGMHRIEAHKLLGREEIDYNVLEFESEEEKKLAEIDENYVRLKLSALQTAEVIVERDKLYSEIQKKSRRVRVLNEKNHQPTTIFGDNLIATRIPEEIKERMYGTELENQKNNLQVFSVLPDEKKIEVLDRKEKQPEKTFREIIEDIRSGKKEYADRVISFKVTPTTYNRLKEMAESVSVSMFYLVKHVCETYANYLFDDKNVVIPAEFEEIFNGMTTLSREDYQQTKKGASI